MKPLTTRQAEVLDFMIGWLLEAQRMPTMREMGWGLGIRSTNGVTEHLRALKRKGFVKHAAPYWRILNHPDGRPFTLRAD